MLQERDTQMAREKAEKESREVEMSVCCSTDGDLPLDFTILLYLLCLKIWMSVF